MPRVTVRNSVRKPMSPRAGMPELEAHAPGAVVGISTIGPRARAEPLGDDADVVLGARRRPGAPSARASTPSTRPRDDLGLADRELVALAAHRLDQDRELELAAAARPGRCRACRSPRRGWRRWCAARLTRRSREVAAGDVLALAARRTATSLTRNTIAIVGSSTRIGGSATRALGVGDACRRCRRPRCRRSRRCRRVGGLGTSTRSRPVERVELRDLARARSSPSSAARRRRGRPSCSGPPLTRPTARRPT